MPSSPAISMAAKARYALQAGSGNRTSIRFAFGLGEYRGIRTPALRLRLGHERRGFMVAARHLFDDVLVPLELIGHLHQGVEPHIDFRLPGRGHFMMMRFDLDTHVFHEQDHLGTEVLLAIHGRYREIPL